MSNAEQARPLLTLQTRRWDSHSRQMLDLYCPELNIGVGNDLSKGHVNLAQSLIAQVEKGVDSIERHNFRTNLPDEMVDVAEQVISAKNRGIPTNKLFGKK